MQRILIAVFSCIFGIGTVLAAAPTAETARTAGDIHGTVKICDLLSIDRVTAHIPGHSYIARPAADGSITFSFVPSGTYDIAFEADTGELVSTLSGVVVTAKQRTELGDINICIDADGDGFNAAVDCNDANSEVYPGAVEVCNLVDDDCDAATDEGFATLTYFRDADHDTWGDPRSSKVACAQPAGYVLDNRDCYDQNSQANPGQNNFFSGHRGDGSYDYNCDAGETKKWVNNQHCVTGASACNIEGDGFWYGTDDTSEPSCGGTSYAFLSCREEWGGIFNTELTCHTNSYSATQQCR